jgi:DASH complex subunit DAD2
MSNWTSVLRAINMASCTSISFLPLISCLLPSWHARSAHKAVAKLPKPKLDEEETSHKIALPQTLVRIPTEHAPALQAQAQEAEAGTDAEE